MPRSVSASRPPVSRYSTYRPARRGKLIAQTTPRARSPRAKRILRTEGTLTGTCVRRRPRGLGLNSESTPTILPPSWFTRSIRHSVGPRARVLSEPTRPGRFPPAPPRDVRPDRARPAAAPATAATHRFVTARAVHGHGRTHERHRPRRRRRRHQRSARRVRQVEGRDLQLNPTIVNADPVQLGIPPLNRRQPAWARSPPSHARRGPRRSGAAARSGTTEQHDPPKYRDT